MVSRRTIDAIHELPIDQVIGRYVQLKQAGENFKACSPFTNEKTASFYVVPRKNFFKDFSSGYGGDAITFVMRHENLSYNKAIERICQDLSIELHYETNGQSKEEHDRIEQLYAINEKAASRWIQVLWQLRTRYIDAMIRELLQMMTTRLPFTLDSQVIEYTFLQRGLSEESSIQFQLGYAPDRWDFLWKPIREAGLYQLALQAGLIVTKNERTFDFFRNRLIFPISDERGRIVGFSGRVMGTDKDTPKYMNTAGTPIFEKGKLLYGLHQAAPAIRKTKFAYLVEGYTDVIMMHQCGFSNTVAALGTSLTAQQAATLRRYCTKVVYMGDADKAGQNAVLKNIDVLLAHGVELHICTLPAGYDPDDFLRNLNKIDLHGDSTDRDPGSKQHDTR